MAEVQITFEPDGRRIIVYSEETLLGVAQRVSFEFTSNQPAALKLWLDTLPHRSCNIERSKRNSGRLH